jgi:uncharacterized membrane-anchored protein YhcB (DUF1043 family)
MMKIRFSVSLIIGLVLPVIIGLIVNLVVPNWGFNKAVEGISFEQWVYIAAGLFIAFWIPFAQLRGRDSELKDENRELKGLLDNAYAARDSYKRALEQRVDEHEEIELQRLVNKIEGNPFKAKE